MRRKSVGRSQRAVGGETKRAYQCVGFGLLEVVAAIERVEPCVQEEFRPFASPEDETTLTETLAVLCEDQVDLVAFEVCEGPDDTVWWYHGLIPKHHRLKALLVHDMGSEGDFWIHNQAVW